MSDAAAVDAAIARGEDPGPLAGVPFAVKNLLDVKGLATLAGSVIRADAPAASEDAASVASFTNAGAVLVGALNMDEFAYGFTTENSHYGATRNPHDLTRVAGGSSGGSAAAVAAGLVPLTLGSDTNGSIRVPAAFCGIYRIEADVRDEFRGAAHFCSFRASITSARLRDRVEDLAVAFDVLNGPDPLRSGCERASEGGIEGFAGCRLGRAADRYRRRTLYEARTAGGVCGRVARGQVSRRQSRGGTARSRRAHAPRLT